MSENSSERGRDDRSSDPAHSTYWRSATIARRVAVLLGLAAAVAVVPCAAAATLEVDPDMGLLRIDSNPFVGSVDWHGVTIFDGGIGADGAREYLVHGDFNVPAGDVVTATLGSLRGVRFAVGNDALLAGTFEFSAAGWQARAGGGAGGHGGAGGAPTAMSNGGDGGWGGRGGDRSGLGGSGGFPSGGGSRGHDGAVGETGMLGSPGIMGLRGGDGQSGAGGSDAFGAPGSGTAPSAGGSGGAGAGRLFEAGPGGDGGFGAQGGGLTLGGLGGERGVYGYGGHWIGPGRLGGDGSGGARGGDGAGGLHIGIGALLVGGGGGAGGGDGNAGGTGGGGAGGTIKVVGSVLEETGRTDINTSGGAGGTAGDDGKFVLGRNDRAAFGGSLTRARSVEMKDASNHNLGSRKINPFVFGLTTLTRDHADIAPLVAGAPGNAKAAMILMDEGPTGLGHAWDGFDMLLIVSIWDQPLVGGRLGFGQDRYLMDLLVGGWARDAQFGGSGYELLGDLGPGAVYATLVPEGASVFNAGFDNCRDPWESADAMAWDTSVWLIPAPSAGVAGLVLVIAIGFRRGAA